MGTIRDGVFFPHLYRSLKIDETVDVTDLELDTKAPYISTITLKSTRNRIFIRPCNYAALFPVFLARTGRLIRPNRGKTTAPSTLSVTRLHRRQLTADGY